MVMDASVYDLLPKKMIDICEEQGWDIDSDGETIELQTDLGMPDALYAIGIESAPDIVNELKKWLLDVPADDYTYTFAIEAGMAEKEASDAICEHITKLIEALEKVET